MIIDVRITIFNFLGENHFRKIKGEKNKMQNNSCIITLTSDGYEVFDKKTASTVYSNNHNIYWLIGYLTYYGHMDKEYKQK